jgi:nitrous oxide reductase
LEQVPVWDSFTVKHGQLQSVTCTANDGINKKYSVHPVGPVEKTTEAFLAASEEIGLEVNADKTKCMVMYRGDNSE